MTRINTQDDLLWFIQEDLRGLWLHLIHSTTRELYKEYFSDVTSQLELAISHIDRRRELSQIYI